MPRPARAHLRTKLSSYKVPRSSDHIVTFADGEIPWINDAKPDKKVARALLAQRLGHRLGGLGLSGRCVLSLEQSLSAGTTFLQAGKGLWAGSSPRRRATLSAPRHFSGPGERS